MPDKPKRKGLAKRPKLGKAPSLSGLKKQVDRMMKDFKDATKKMTVHQEPRSKTAASLRSLLDQPRSKVPKSPHRDKKKHKYAGAFKKKP